MSEFIKHEILLKKFKEDTSLFWNIDNTSNAGFIIPVERYSSNPELYYAVYRLMHDQYMLFWEIFKTKTNTSSLDETMPKLYANYKKVFEGKFSYDIFCSICDKDFNDESIIHCSWKDRRTLIYDETLQEAYVLAALPEKAFDSCEKDNITYRFISEKIVKIEEVWKLSDGCLSDFKKFG